MTTYNGLEKVLFAVSAILVVVSIAIAFMPGKVFLG